jgi:hypothetical protein
MVGYWSWAVSHKAIAEYCFYPGEAWEAPDYGHVQSGEQTDVPQSRWLDLQVGDHVIVKLLLEAIRENPELEPCR